MLITGDPISIIKKYLTLSSARFYFQLNGWVHSISTIEYRPWVCLCLFERPSVVGLDQFSDPKEEFGARWWQLLLLLLLLAEWAGKLCWENGNSIRCTLVGEEKKGNQNKDSLRYFTFGRHPFVWLFRSDQLCSLHVRSTRSKKTFCIRARR